MITPTNKIARIELANAIRALSMDAVQKANSGHPGMPMGMADIAEVLWNDFLKHNPHDPHWPNRDRFILSNGHGSMLQYSLLHLTGYDLSLEDLQQFRQLHSKTPGHPEFGLTPGVETTTGPLGQGLAAAVGMALAEELTADTFNKPNNEIVNHYTYCFVGDGCLMEGLSHEVCSLAGTLGLGKLIVFWDNNGISIDGEVENWFNEDVPARFQAYHWQVIADVDGHDPQAVRQAILAAQAERNKPTLICCKTVIGFGAPTLAGTAATHGAPLGAEEVAAARRQLGWQHPPFVIPPDIYQAWDARDKGASWQQAWEQSFAEYAQQHPQLAAEFKRRLAGELPAGWQDKLAQLLVKTQQDNPSIATRKASQQILVQLVGLLPELFGGSADLSCSNLTITNLSKAINNKFEKKLGNYLYYGVREFGMAGIMNGMVLYRGFIPYGGTFLTFIDYARSAARMSAIMRQRVIYVLTHDSIGLGEDGPTHQPIEHLAMLRLTPNFTIWRPCDAVETVVAWQMAIEHTQGPTVLALTRQNVVGQPRTAQQCSEIKYGGYILSDGDGAPELILIATGSEVELVMQTKKLLQAEDRKVRVVSMPSVEVFLAQPVSYQNKVLPKATPKLVVEAGATGLWYKIVGKAGKVIGIDRFGESAPAADVFQALGLTVDNILLQAKSLVSKGVPCAS